MLFISSKRVYATCYYYRVLVINSYLGSNHGTQRHIQYVLLAY